MDSEAIQGLFAVIGAAATAVGAAWGGIKGVRLLRKEPDSTIHQDAVAARFDAHEGRLQTLEAGQHDLKRVQGDLESGIAALQTQAGITDRRVQKLATESTDDHREVRSNIADLHETVSRRFDAITAEIARFVRREG